MATVTFDAATRLFPGATRPAVNRLDLDIEDGEFLVLVGPSGCGKSTAFGCSPAWSRQRGGIRSATVTSPAAQGTRHRDGLPELRPVPAHDRGGQHGLRAEDRGRLEGGARPPRPRRQRNCSNSDDSRPQAGGAVRRPAAARRDGPGDRARAQGVPDGRTAVQPGREAAGTTRTQIAALQARLGTTTVYVTHDQVEAMTMGDRVAVMKDGILQQVDTPLRLYEAR